MKNSKNTGMKRKETGNGISSILVVLIILIVVLFFLFSKNAYPMEAYTLMRVETVTTSDVILVDGNGGRHQIIYPIKSGIYLEQGDIVQVELILIKTAMKNSGYGIDEINIVSKEE